MNLHPVSTVYESALAKGLFFWVFLANIDLEFFTFTHCEPKFEIKS